MAIMDYRLEFCDATAVSGAVATTVRGNVLDLGVNAKNYGAGTPVYLHVRMNTIAAGKVTATMAMYLQDARTNIAASFANILTLKSACTPVATEYALGKVIYNGILPAGITLKQYIRLVTTIAGSPVTAGRVDAWLDLSD